MSDTGKTEGSCAVCSKAATTRCGSCKLAFYCGKEHQREHWPRHKTSCRAYEERENQELGRHLLATRDLKPDDLIISEAPIVWGPSSHVEERVCVGCGVRDAVCRCPNCAWPACRLACDGLVDENRHGYECGILAKARLMPRCDYLLILRVLILRRKNPKKWRVLSKLQSHEESRGPGTEAHEEMEAVKQYLGSLLSLDQGSAEALPKVCGLIDVNALETNPPEGSAAIYETACLLEHRCVANTRYSFELDEQGRPRINVYAVTDIKKADHLSTTYTHVLWATRVRREHLLATKYFSCRCERCADPTELGSHLGTLKCPCEKGFVTPDDPLNPETDWSCKDCPGVLSAGEVAQLTDRLGEEVDAAMSAADKDIMSDLLFRLTVLLHPCHQHCLTIGHSLMQLLPADDPKKAELCQRMIDTIALVDPYGARLSLYRAIALRELSMCPGQDRNELLFKAIQALRYEPPHSASGLLAKVILAEI
ncbi:SET domain-containing protein SmydA-8 [Nasonia vitripennis]|uniref:MYND-type domain-containing protein n=1 Tax=Nasonia vitripennis TaxID=7425 RepID=A0A7M7G2Z2_NASVI|nr:SET domain-containing protein SmydA-8 [Nasonia vitripennis]